ncbi:LRR receptor-like serine/threonine-protein kinase GSO1 [Citrus clementina]|uniref:LRR receptor-like serine/threonine-protein kinase GSO1 n=1 Tax=Citrus clementina TaxID=85681 RepID=UPI000CED3C3D|nr:LRR receptor-like serine/threonine-protein kinase GSO1 [Citrus x clementina]
MVIMFVMLLIIFKSGWSEGCLDHERFALLRLKHLFDDTGSYPYDWVDGEGAIDCCQWERVECSNTTGRVIALDLFEMYSGEYSWYLNASLFTPFQQLESLDLTDNKIAGCVENEGLERLSRLNNLKMLNLSENSFNNSILSSLTHLSSLRSLNLFWNRLEGSIDFKEFDSLRDLEELDIGANKIDKFVVSKGLSKLKSLDLSGIKLNRSILSSLTVFSSLRELHLRDIGFKGTFDVRGLCSLMHLQELYKVNNDLRGSLPWCVANMTSLRILDVSSNQLTGSIASSPLAHLTSIEELHLSDNHFRIPISLEPLFNHSRLKIFDAENNELNAEITESYSLTTPNFQLQYLLLSSGYGDGATFPKFLYHQHDLEYVDLSHTKMNGEFPNWLLENNTKLKTLFLVNDSLAGPFRLPIHSHKRLRQLDVSNNNFQGHIPLEIGDILPNLISFNISMNALDGSIPSSFGNINLLKILDLSNNQLTGEIPEHLAVGCVYLDFLALSNNSLEGHMFSRNFNLKNLKWLQLEGNRFVGEIPQSLSKCSSLKGLYLNNNSLSGKIPRWLGNLTWLQYIIMPNNHLEGPIPVEFCQLYSLQILDISNNNISESLPSSFHPRFIKQVHLSKNMLHGQLNRGHNNLEGEVPVQLCELNRLQLLDLSNNNLHGPIPPCFDNTTLHESYSNSYSLDEQFEIFVSIEGSWGSLIGHIPPQIGNLTRIQTLNLSHNNLTGLIPSTFSNLKHIESLDLSYNKLNGKIPHQLVELKTLEVFSLAFNNLSGEIPEWKAQFATFNESSYEGNTFLCGLPLPICRSPATTPEASIGNERDDNLIDMDNFFITFTTSYVIVIFGIVVVLYVNPYWRCRWFYFVEMWITSCYYFVVDNLIPTRFCH